LRASQLRQTERQYQDNLRKAVREIVVDDNKREQADFALWKKDDKHSCSGTRRSAGLPRLALECSVMARKYLETP